MRKMRMRLPNGQDVIVNVATRSQLEDSLMHLFDRISGMHNVDMLTRDEEQLPRYYLNTEAGRNRFKLDLMLAAHPAPGAC